MQRISSYSYSKAFRDLRIASSLSGSLWRDGCMGETSEMFLEQMDRL